MGKPQFLYTAAALAFVVVAVAGCPADLLNAGPNITLTREAGTGAVTISGADPVPGP
jgi:hypothetical protein